MNELELMESFRAEVSPADPVALRDARAAMLRPEVAARPRRWVWGLVPAGALATAAVAIAVTVVASGPAEAPVRPAPVALDGPQVLRLAAAEARQEPVLTARGDQFVFVESTVALAGQDGRSSTPAVPENRRVWLSVDGSRPGLLRQTPVDKATTSHTPELANMPLDAGTPAYVKNLPGDPAKMRTWLFQGTQVKKPGGNPPEVTAFVKVGDTLREQYLPPESAAALFEAAATIPHVKVVPGAVDLAGRKGVAVSLTDHAGTQHQLIFDAGTHRFLGERDVATGGSVVSWTAQLRVAIVDEPGQLP